MKNDSWISVFKESVLLVYKSAPISFILLCIFIFMSSALPLLAISFSSKLVNTLHDKNMSKSISYLILWGGMVSVNYLISPIIQFLQVSLSDKAVYKINEHLIVTSNKLKSLVQFENKQHYDDIQLISSQAYHKPVNLIVTITGILKDLIIIFSSIFLLFPSIGLNSLAIILTLALHAYFSSKLQNEVWKESLGRSLKSRFMNYLSSISILPSFASEIRLFNLGQTLLKKYKEIFLEIYSKMFKIRLKQSCIPIFTSIILVSVSMFSLYTCIQKVFYEGLLIGQIVLLLQLLYQMQISTISLGEQIGWMFGHVYFFRKYFEFLEKKDPDHVMYSNLQPKKELNSIESITFKEVSFEYHETQKTISNVSFKINAGEKIAIVGLNGAGKSTLIKLLLGFYPPSSGKILINDNDICSYDLLSVRSKISPVFQEYGKYGFKVYENIIMGSNYEKEKLDKVIKASKADFIYDLFDCERTLLGKMFDGTDISAGQWQRIAIARALYKNGDAYILDEPSSALDPLSEQKLFSMFTDLIKDKMVIFITHRLTSIKLADKIMVLDKGCVVAFDKHEELMKHCELYKNLYLSQASKFHLG